MTAYIIRCPDGSRWKVRQAISLKAALNEIAHARVTGSVGSSTIVDETLCGGTKRAIADVIRIYKDGTEVKPYPTKVY